MTDEEYEMVLRKVREAAKKTVEEKVVVTVSA